MRQKKIDKILDVKGLPCPTPTAMTGKTLKDMQKGKILQVITNDMTTKETIPSLCAKEGYELIEVKEENGLLYYFVSR
jgi:TusA-related sulfurtransferase